MNEKVLTIVGGPNGSGKSSVYGVITSRKNPPLPYLNADLIAVASSGIPGAVGEIEAGRIFLGKLQSCLKNGESLAIESTLSGLVWKRFICEARAVGYIIVVVFVTLDSVDRSLDRIKNRVKLGGHDIPEDSVRRRWPRAHHNFLNTYAKLADHWYLFDNSGAGARIVAASHSGQLVIYNEDIFGRITQYG